MNLLKRIFVRNNMLRIYATRKENEVHELRNEINELKLEILNQDVLIEEKNKLLVKAMEERDLFYENLTKAKKEKLAAQLTKND